MGVLSCEAERWWEKVGKEQLQLWMGTPALWMTIDAELLHKHILMIILMNLPSLTQAIHSEASSAWDTQPLEAEACSQ
jgi:hypothetical protein